MSVGIICEDCGTKWPASAGECPNCGLIPSASFAGFPLPPDVDSTPRFKEPAEAEALIYATFGTRLIALIADGLFLGFTLFGSWIALAIVFQSVTGADPDSPALDIAGILTITIVPPLYFILLESSSWRGTIGKRAVGIRVVGYDGMQLSLGQAIVRYFARGLSAMFLFIGFIVMIFTTRRQTLHDLIARTLVVQR